MPSKVCLANSQEELEELFRFRYQIYVEEQGLSPAGVSHERRVFSDDLDEYSTSWYVRSEGEITGSLRLTCLSDLPNLSLMKGKFNFEPALKRFQKTQLCTTSRFVLSSKVSGRTALNLMKEGMIYGINRGLKLNYGDCSPHMLPFYNRLGYRVYTNAYNDPDYGYKFPIVMLGGDKEWLEKNQSPLRHLDIELSGESREWFNDNYLDHSRNQNLYLDNPLNYLERIQLENPKLQLLPIQILSGMTREEKISLLLKSVIIDCEKGDIIMRPDVRDEALYTIISGSVKLHDISSNYIELDSGQSFSNSTKFSQNYPRNFATVQENSKILVLGREALGHLERIQPEAIVKVDDEIQAIISALYITQCQKAAV